MSQDKQLYESDRVWNQDMQPGQKNLLQALVDFMPEDTATILDVGCGDGKITQQLITATGKRIVGLDSSKEALSRCTFERVLGDATELGFEDKAFDTVMTTDMLEHLPEDIEEKAWQELFRVAAKTVLVAVPFREELLDGTAHCECCGTNYHVNWHMRSYDWPRLVQRAPEGWRATGIVLTGEPWSPYHPIETHFRRELLDEWSGWGDAICPQCGTSGKAAQSPAAFPEKTAVALGRLVYSDVIEHSIARAHSEILVVYRRNNDGEDFVMERNIPLAKAVRQEAGVARIFTDKLEPNLLPYSLTGRAVATSDGGIVVQLPVYADNNSLRIVWRDTESSPLSITVEDGLGMLFSGNVSPGVETDCIVKLLRLAVPGYYGVLVQLPMTDAVASLELGGGPTGLALSPDEGFSTGYYQSQFGTCPAFIQVTTSFWLDVENLASEATPTACLGWRNLFDEIEQISMAERDALAAERDALAAERDALAAERDALAAERDALAARPEVRLLTILRDKFKSLKRSGR